MSILTDAGANASCLDFSTWPALAADHSCSPSDLLGDVLKSGWALDVARVSAGVKSELAAATSKHARENAWVLSNLQLQSVDDRYVTRAGANNAHFLLSRVTAELDAFALASVKAGAPLNALGLYQQYHVAAITLASATRKDRAPSPDRAAQILALEAYALHFLQDIYSSGHVAGTWGDAATRKGTHDYYSVNGHADTTWSGQQITLHGDAHMQKDDLARASRAIAMSMEQVFDAAGKGSDAGLAAIDAAGVVALNSCTEMVQPAPISRRLRCPATDPTRWLGLDSARSSAPSSESPLSEVQPSALVATVALGLEPWGSSRSAHALATASRRSSVA
ncbi:MAG: hypothetical protein U0174_21955 [Polyangiaceae bacterium]